jgi:hypothetical protein
MLAGSIMSRILFCQTFTLLATSMLKDLCEVDSGKNVGKSVNYINLTITILMDLL